MTQAETRTTGTLAPYLPEDDASMGESDPSLWATVQERMRGRWIPAILIGVLLSAVLAAAGYLLPRPQYTSVGSIMVVPKLPPVLSETPETELMPLYFQYMATQAHLVMSRRVLERAMQDEELQAHEWAREPEALVELTEDLEARPDGNTQLVFVKFTAPSPDVAQAVVNAVLRAYDELYGSAGGDEIAGKLQQLVNLRTDLRNQLRQQKQAIQDYQSASPFALGDLGQMLQIRYAQMQQLEYEIGRVDEMVATLDALEAGDDTSTIEPSPEQLDSIDPNLAEVRRRLRQAEIEFELSRHRYRPHHLAFKRMEGELTALRDLFQELETGARETWIASGGSTLMPGEMNGQPLDRAGLVAKRDRLQGELERYREQARELTLARQHMADMQAEVDRINVDLGSAEDRIRQLEINEDELRSGRISIAAFGDYPLTPSRDRRPQLAAVGAIGGIGLSLGFFFLLGTVDRRNYGLAQLAMRLREAHCLGVLPNLAGEEDDEESCAIAANCIHRIRNHIDALRPAGRGYVLAVSSPADGDGKSNLVMALGWSYAAAGLRTIIVDCDLAGRGLSRYTGYAEAVGLKEVMRDGHLNGEVAPLPVANLCVLPVGNEPGFRPERLRTDELRKVLTRLREEYDVILIDTGPVVASVESLPVVSAADGVVLVVRRGTRQSKLDEAIRHLRTAGATFLGVVLNCADRADCEHYFSRSRESDSTRRPRQRRSRPAKRTLRSSSPHAPSGALVRALEAASQRSQEDRGA